MQRPFNRRTFLQSASVGATALASPRAARGRIAGSNDRISIGIIGCGERGLNAHMTAVGEHSETQNLEITAVCDPWNRRRERAAAKVKELYGRAPHLCVSHCDLLALEDVDAVMIASPDHVHTAQIEAAARAGKDIYCEKPLGMEIDKLKSACDAVREAGVVFQAGTQLRSFPSMTGCRELYRTGVLGAVSRIEQCRNSSRPYWYNYLREARPEDVAWEEFLGGRPKRPFSADQFTGWYGYLDFAGGPVPTLGSHFVDLVHYITGAIFPTSAVCQGGTVHLARSPRVHLSRSRPGHLGLPGRIHGQLLDEFWKQRWQLVFYFRRPGGHEPAGLECPDCFRNPCVSRKKDDPRAGDGCPSGSSPRAFS